MGFKCDVLLALEHLTQAVQSLTTTVKTMADELATLMDRVAEIESVGDSVIEVLTAVRAELAAAIAANDMTLVQQANDRLGAQAAEIAAAVVANTTAVE